MTSPIGLSGLVVDVVIMLVLLIAVVSPRVSRLARPLIATFAFVSAWLLTAVFDALRAPGLTIFMGGAVIVVSFAAIIVTVHLWTQAGDDSEGGPGQKNEGRGGPRRRPPDGPQHGGGGSDPSWWPEFERRLALYVAKRDETRPAVLPPAPPPHATTRGGN